MLIRSRSHLCQEHDYVLDQNGVISICRELMRAYYQFDKQSVCNLSVQDLIGRLNATRPANQTPRNQAMSSVDFIIELGPLSFTRRAFE